MATHKPVYPTTMPPTPDEMLFALKQLLRRPDDPDSLKALHAVEQAFSEVNKAKFFERPKAFEVQEHMLDTRRKLGLNSCAAKSFEATRASFVKRYDLKPEFHPGRFSVDDMVVCLDLGVPYDCEVIFSVTREKDSSNVQKDSMSIVFPYDYAFDPMYSTGVISQFMRRAEQHMDRYLGY